MTIIRKSTKKAITRQIKKIIKKHGPEIAMAIVTDIVTGITAAALAKDGDKQKKAGGKKKKKAKS